MTQRTKVLTCPFCNSETEINYAFNAVKCINEDCNARVTGSCVSKAIENWNKRNERQQWAQVKQEIREFHFMHKGTCAVWDTVTPCNCGLKELLTKLEGLVT